MAVDFSTKEKRPEIDPKLGFLDQLRSLEDDLGENRNWLLKACYNIHAFTTVTGTFRVIQTQSEVLSRVGDFQDIGAILEAQPLRGPGGIAGGTCISANLGGED